jgi:NAD(P)-dependent dehydrogenase (short-subunit alcohol dehydrogenase family)
MKKLKDKVAIITGAGRGIGKAMAVGLSKEGASVVVCDIVLENAGKTAGEIVKAGGRAIPVGVDVTRETQVEDMVRTVLKRWKKIDILVNNAGIYPRAEVLQMTENIWDRTIDVNLKGTFLCSKHAARSMVENRQGKIVNTTSGVGRRGQKGGAHYAASKAGIVAFTQSLAMEMAPHNIQVNALAPGLTDTELSKGAQTQAEIEKIVAGLPNKAIGKPEEAVLPLLFLVGDGSDHITGQVIYMRTIG